MIGIKEKEQKTFEALKEQFGYTNKLAAPKIIKVVVSSGTGKASRTDKKRNDFIAGRLTKITGQKPMPRGAKKSIASFKVREGDSVGFAVNLHGGRMYGFLDKVLNIALPRTRDFRGLSPSAVDDMGNYTIGIKEHIVFPETSDEELKDVFGLAITIVTTAKTKKEALAFFEHLGFPFKK
ncbi:50S ribosomal protein L5 [bacterium]|nr:50S ribosomal protein L5 [bacterium]|tara:strand:+ start:1888 stop:2427 length:540 start_codon:yes stop_codon:yes gene_type:complete